MKLAPLAALGLAAAFVLTGCSSTSTDQNGSDSALNAQLPDNIQEAGVLRIGGLAALPPYLYKDGPNVAGFEKEIMDALGEALDVTIEFQDTQFAGLIPGLQSGKLDVAMGDFTDTVERQQVVTFIDYTTSYQTLFVPAGNPKNLDTVDDLCGTTIALIPGSVGDKVAQEQQTECEAAGKPGPTKLEFQDAAAAFTQVQTGRADVFIIDYVIGRHAAESGGVGEIAGEPFFEQFHGAAVRKGNDQLADALVAAFTEIMDNGTYAEILESHDMDKLLMDAPVINGATS